MTQNWYQKTKHIPGVLEKKRLSQQAWRANNREKTREYHRIAKRRDPVPYLLKQARQRAKAKDLEFSISREDIVIPEFCPYLSVKLNVSYEKGFHSDSPSLDRIDSSKGYIKGNVQVISSQANRMKWDATQEQLIQFAKGVLEKEGALC